MAGGLCPRPCLSPLSVPHDSFPTLEKPNPWLFPGMSQHTFMSSPAPPTALGHKEIVIRSPS